MDRNNSLERRYSFNTAQCNPIAESTHLNSGFCWGSSSLSPKQRSNSSICLNNTQNDSRRTIYTSPTKSANVTKIDARIVADVQSKGLASRIVKYHESGTRLNRSMSAHNLYSKPGQFPVVTLKKTDLPYRATKQNLSMTRIAPPEKSMFYGNALSSLLRSNSVVGLQKSNEDISRENRPILHPPPTENDMAPTRSVLDVLKEISRKRINSDDLDTTEATKKYCNRDLVDTGINSSCSNFPSTHLTPSGKSFKRQRDVNAPYQSIQIQETRTSPEQDKKRLCNYNNDITSSLSSSSRKRKPYEQNRPSYYLNQTMPTNLESYEIQKAKVQRHHEQNHTQADLRFDNLANNLKKVDTIKPITPIPATASTQDQSSGSNGVAPQRTVSEPLYKLDDRKTTLTLVHPANKPRLTLFNKNYDVETENGESESLADNDDDSDECAGIQFVKPKKLTSKTGIKNPVIERTQKSKLALMLSGLRGELYQTSDTDELDSSKAQEKTQVSESVKNTNTISVPKSAASTSSKTLTTITTTSTTSNNGIQNKSNAISLTTNSTATPASAPITATTTTTTTTTPAKSASPLVGIKLTPTKSKTENGFNLNSENKANAEATKSVPVLGGFSFGTVPNLATSLATPTTNSNTKSIGTSATATALAGIATFTGFDTTVNKLIAIANSAQLVNVSTTPAKDNSIVVGAGFSVPTTTSANLNTNSMNSLQPVAAFSFGTLPTASASTKSLATQLGDTAAKPNATFNFGVSTSSNTPTTGTVAAPVAIAFGSLSATTTNTTTSSNTLSFGSNLKATTSSAAPVFGTAAVATTNTLANTSFSFGTSSNQPKSTNETPSAGFSFGSNTTAAPASTFTPNSSTTMKSQPLTTTPFSFGSATAGSNTSQTSAVNNNASSVFNSNDNKDNKSVFNSVAPSVFGGPPPAFGASATSGSVFNSPTTNTNNNVFGSSNTTSTSVFGATSSNSNTQTFGTSTEANKSTSVFGSTNVNSPSPSFSFGSKAADKPTTNNPSSTPSGGFSFGSAAGNNSASTSFAFGATSQQSSTTNPSNNATNNTFGTLSSPNLPNKTFAFGSSNNKMENNSTNLFGAIANKPTENTASTNLFGGSTSKPTESTASSGGFSFGSAIAAKPSTSSSFSFGSNRGGNTSTNNMTTNNAASTGFSFGAAAPSKSTDISANKSFSFGGPTSSPTPQTLGVPNNNTTSSNIFGSAPTAKTAPPPAFNFGAPANNVQSSAVAPTNNIFAPPPTNMSAGPGDRPIRRATRRLQK